MAACEPTICRYNQRRPIVVRLIMRTITFMLCLPFLALGCDSQESKKLASQPDANSNVATAGNTQSPPADPNPESGEIPPQVQLDSKLAMLDQDIASLKQKVAGATSPQQAGQILTQENPVPQFVQDMIDLAMKYPQTQTAVDAMLAAVARSQGEQKVIAMDHLLEHFSDRLKLKKMIDQFLKEIPSPATESYILKIVQTAPSPESKAYAMLGYSNYVDQIQPFCNALRANPRLSGRLPKSQMDYINTPRTKQQKEMRESVLESLIEDHSDLVYRGRKTFGDVASAELYELQNLSVGKTAPDLVGNDMDGMEFRLSDYRGKIVMLDFWGHWCPPCRAMYGHEQQLVEQLGGVPFALIGVNSDPKIETAINAINDENLSWRNFWIGPKGTNGPIAKQWNIAAWPTVYLIDADGVVRHKDILGDDLNAALQEMLAEMGHEVDLEGIQ